MPDIRLHPLRWHSDPLGLSWHGLWLSIALVAGYLLSACTAVKDPETVEPQAGELSPAPAAAVSETVTPRPAQANNETVIVQLPVAAYAQIAPIESLLVVEYRWFVWLELTPEAFRGLVESGVDFARQPDATVLKFPGKSFDTRLEIPAVPANVRADYPRGAPGFFAVQVLGPVKGEWVDRLQGAGATIIQPLPTYAYLVRMTPEEAIVVDSFEFVRWVGPYHPAYKIGPSLADLEANAHVVNEGVIEDVDILYVADESAQTLETIKSFGAIVVKSFTLDPAVDLVGVTVKLPESAVIPIARLNEVVRLSYGSPEVIPEEE